MSTQPPSSFLRGQRSNYDLEPSVAVPAAASAGACAGWPAITERLAAATPAAGLVAVDGYVGVHFAAIREALEPALEPASVIDTADLLKPAAEIDALVAPWLGGDDPIFGVLSTLRLHAFFDAAKLDAARTSAAEAAGSTRVLVLGVGATLVTEGLEAESVTVYADMPRWEGQLRQRRDEVGNLGVGNHGLKASLQYKRSYFVDWRVCDRHKKPLLRTADFFLDTTDAETPKLAPGAGVRAGLRAAMERPFRVVPFFDPGPWGGQWMREVCGLAGRRDPEPPNYAWGFDCVPEENSLVLRFGDAIDLELPSVDALFLAPADLLGDPVHARFGDEFPIRFDFLDTMGGGNLSFQVHPLTEYIQQHFGMAYTQDESYYLLDAGEEGTCYLGFKGGVDPARVEADLRTAQAGGEPFPAEEHVNVLPAKKHDHFLIPAGTVHCSGKDTMVLEISATPYIFTFKLWDWGRLGLDGQPRPINIDRGLQNIAWDRDTAFCERELVNCFEEVASGEGWREERTGLHRREFIETRRHWFTGTVPHDTGGVARGGVHVLNLVEGREAVVESPTGDFEPFVVHYAETWIVPAAVGRYTVRPHGESEGTECATLRASVRTGLEAPHV